MTIKDLLKLEIVSRGKLRAMTSAPSIEMIDGESVICADTHARVYTLTPALWDALMSDEGFKNRFATLQTMRELKRAEKLDTENKRAENLRNEGRKSVLDSVAIAKACMA